jgi:DNA ligase (NAD+)
MNTARQYIVAPSTCPSCKADLVRDGEYLMCKNDDCEAQAAGAIKRWVKKIGILHFGGTLIEAILDDFPQCLTDKAFEDRFAVDYDEQHLVVDPVKREEVSNARMNIADLYLLDPDRVAALTWDGRTIGGTATKGFRNLNAKKILPLHVIVGSLGIPMIGRSMAKTIIDAGYDNLSKLYKARISQIASIPGVGQSKADAFVTGFAKRAGMVGKLVGEAGIEVQVVSGALAGKTFCFTGFRDNDLQETIEKNGGTVKGGVSKGLNYLVMLDPTSTSGKAMKARKYGTDLITPDEARTLVEGTV